MYHNHCTVKNHTINKVYKLKEEEEDSPQYHMILNRGVISTRYNCVCSLVLVTLKMAAWVVEPFLWLPCNKITFKHPSAFVGPLINFTHVQGVSFFLRRVSTATDVAARSAVPNTESQTKKNRSNLHFGQALLRHESSLFTSRLEATTEKTETPITTIRTPHLARLLRLVLLRT
jgi:hypothetical protein